MYEEIFDYIEEENIKFIRLAFFDIYGTQKNIAIMPEELEKALTEGVSFDASSILGFGGEVKSDLFLKPDPRTISIVPWRPVDGRVARMFCDIEYPDGRNFELDTRNILKEAVKKGLEKGISVDFGTEMEFYIFKVDEHGNMTFIPQDNATYMDIAPLDHGENIRREISLALVDMGIRPESSHHEIGPGQNEVDFRYSDALTAADNASTFKWVVRSVAQSDGLWASFSPKPLKDRAGNGMHINISVNKERDPAGENETPGSGYTDVELSRFFMAGILKYIREITLFLNPLQESYERLGSMKAPGFVSWSRENRSQLIRIPATRSGRERMELRSPDPMANPYLAFTLLIYAGLSGIEERLELMDSVDENLYRASAGLMESLKSLPHSREEAVSLAESSEFLRKHLPLKLIEGYYGKE